MEKSLESSRVRPESEMLPHDHGLDRVSFLTINRNGIKERAEPTAVIAKVLNVHNVNGDERGKVHGA